MPALPELGSSQNHQDTADCKASMSRMSGGLCTVLYRTAKADWAEMERTQPGCRNKRKKFPSCWVQLSHFKVCNAFTQQLRYLWTSSSGTSRSLSATSQRPAQVHPTTPSPTTAGPLKLSPISQVILRQRHHRIFEMAKDGKGELSLQVCRKGRGLAESKEHKKS